ncbi:MAG: DUF4386 domain-containing protein [Chloroflexi bacterium]|nr:MAG: DUF4386 domain-containing protein [Chloroflexota bacterium]
MYSNKKMARIAGVLYVIIIAAGIFAEFFVRQSLIAPGDAAATAGNIAAAEPLFRLGIAADLVMILADVALALLFYILLKPVSQPLSLLAAFFRLGQAAILAVNLLNLFVGLQLVTGAATVTALGAAQAQALGLLFLGMHGVGYTIGLVLFAASILLVGYLVFKSSDFPAILGVLLVVAAAGYFIDGFARVLLPNYGDIETILTLIVFLPAFIGELSFAVWLLVKGVKTPRPQLRPSHAF